MSSTATPAPRFNASSTGEEVATALAEQIRGKHVLITGVSPGGLGAEAARVIAKHAPALLILASRSQAKIDETAATIRAESPSVEIRTLLLDLASFEAIRKSAAEVNTYTEPIDVLVNNAGLMFTGPERHLSADGFEATYATNYLGPFLFTNLIKPRLVASSGARVVNLASAAHAFGPEIRFNDINFGEEGAYQPLLAYAHSKSANILFNAALAEKWQKEGVETFALHPGAIWTPGVESVKVEFMAGGFVTKDGEPSPDAGWSTMERGTATHIVAAFDPALKGHSGAYLTDGQIANNQAHPSAMDKATASKLWAATEEILKQKFD